MSIARENLITLEQRVKVLLQQQKTFISALERTRECAHDRITPVKTLEQVRNYLDNCCSNTTDKHILSLFLDICADLSDFCTQLESMQNCPHPAREIIEQTITLLSPSNDLSGLIAKYPHDVVQHLSCDEAGSFYCGVVSLVPIALDKIREAVSMLERSQPLNSEMADSLEAIQKNKQDHHKAENQGVTQNTGVQTAVSQGESSAHPVRRRGYQATFEPAWKPYGHFYTS